MIGFKEKFVNSQSYPQAQFVSKARRERMTEKQLYNLAEDWFRQQDWKPYPFQLNLVGLFKWKTRPAECPHREWQDLCTMVSYCFKLY